MNNGKSLLTFDTKEIRSIQLRMMKLGNQANLILSRVVNRSISSISKNMKEQVTDEYRLKSARVKKTIQTKRKATANNPTALIVSKDRHPTLTSFYFKSVRKGSKKMKNGKFRPSVYEGAVKEGGTHALSGRPKPFLQRVNGNLISVRRVSDDPGERKLEGVYGPAVPQILKNKEILDAITVEASKMFHKRIDHELDRALKGR